MRSRIAWLVATMLAYGVIGGALFDSAIWGGSHGLAWTRASVTRVCWAAAVFLAATIWLVRIALYAGAAFLTDAIVTWGVVDFLVRGSQHGWDTDFPGRFANRYLYCPCAPRGVLLRQSVIAGAAGTVLSAALAPLVSRIAARAVPPRSPRTSASPREL